MHYDEFEAPPTIWVVMSVVGGIATGLGLITSLEYLGDRFFPTNRSMRNSLLALEKVTIPKDRPNLSLSVNFSSAPFTNTDPGSHTF